MNNCVEIKNSTYTVEVVQGSFVKHCYMNCGDSKMCGHQKLYIYNVEKGFFSKFLVGGDSIFFVPFGPRRGRSQMGGGDLPKIIRWSQNIP